MTAEPTLAAPLHQEPISLDEWQQKRWHAFLSSQGGHVFSSIAQARDIWSGDPFDEETIHAEARQTFSELLEIMADRERGEAAGRILLLKGDSGSGKTHLMGAFRRQVERTGAGYFAYAQMSTEAPSLGKYLLRNIVSSLQKSGPLGEGGSPWLRLSDALVERPSIPLGEREALRNDEDYTLALRAIHSRLQEDLKPTPGSDHLIHSDFLTALLVLQRRDGNAQSAAMKYFAGDPLSETDCQWLCSPNGLAGTGEPERLTDWLLQAMRRYGGAHGGAFVLCLDQIEDLYEPAAPHQQRFPEIVTILRTLSDRHPGLLVVLACLQDYYTTMRSALKPPECDRLELNPKPVTLTLHRTEEEILALVRRRLEVLDAEAGNPLPPSGSDPLYPFAAADLAQLRNLRPRAILTACHDAWLRSRRSNQPPRIDLPQPALANIVYGHEVQPPPEPAASPWDQRWNDFRFAWGEPVPKRQEDLAEILAWSINALAQQTRTPVRGDAAADLVHLTMGSDAAIASICNHAAQGGRLAVQLDSLQNAAAAAGRPAIALRNTDFPKSPRAKITQRVRDFLAANNRTLSFPDADWNTVHAWRAFCQENRDKEDLSTWAATAQPLAEVHSLRALLRLDDLRPAAAPQEPPSQSSAEPLAAEATTRPGSSGAGGTPTHPSGEAPLDPDQILLGTSLGLRPEPIPIQRAAFTQHIAVLGGTGSGKTTAAMVLLEGLLLRGIPVILVDRKGDLARYADSTSLSAIPGPGGARFRERVDVALFTPGDERGRPLALSVLPAPIPDATSQDIRTQSTDAGAALSAMLGYTESRTHAARRAALVAAIGVLLEIGDPAPSLDRLLSLMNTEDPALLQALGYIDKRNLTTLVQDLDSFRKLNAPILGVGAEPLEAARLLGLDIHARPGKTRLSIISTKFLGANQVVQFWVAQLMMELARFASARPSRELQAAIMLDEADLYLPAVGKPASKQPVENALRRFRSGGLGLLLASQSPGDFDYRCRDNIGTWLVGKISQRPAIEKLRPIFGETGATSLERLAQHPTGEFCLVRPTSVTRLQSHRNLLPTEQMSDTEILRAAKEMI